MNLNQAQRQAIFHQSGPLLIVAGAGTGKTTVIAERIKQLIQRQQVDPYHIFATTFTEKAAAELIARLDQVMPLGYRQPWVGTFHSLCERILRQEGLEMGINPNFTLMNQTDQWMFLKEHLSKLNLKYYKPISNPSRFISAIMKYFSRLADESISTSSLQKYAQKKGKTATTQAEASEADRLLELAQAHQAYTQLKYENSVFDFGDVINQVILLFKNRPNILANFQHQFQHVIIDEFQDTNAAQFELIQYLAPADTSPNLVVVGDDDQAIYKFRGASVSNILKYKSIYPHSKEIVLTTNYRSTQQILDAAYHSIVNNNPDRLEHKLSINKQLQSIVNQIGETSIHAFLTIDQEIDWTIKQIATLVATHQLPYQHIAVLARTNSQLEGYAQALKHHNIPYQLVANRGLFDQPLIAQLITFLRVIVDPHDDQSLFQLSQSSFFSLSPKQMLEMAAQAKREGIFLYQLLSRNHDQAIQSLINTITTYQEQSAVNSVSQLLYQFIESSGVIKPLIQTDSMTHQLTIRNLNLFFNQLKQFERSANQPTVIEFLQALELWLEAGENPGQAQIEDIDTVSLMTIHMAKGLEFEAVFIPSLVAGRFPTSRRKDPIVLPDELIKETLPQGDEHIQEERRLFYVAMTRAKQFLYLTYAEDVGGARKRRVSGFVAETNLPTINHTQSEFSEAITSTTTKIPTYLQPASYTINTVSYSQLDTFDVCPLKYKYRYLLKIPAKPHHSLSFGRSIHQTLYEYHLLLKQKQTVTLAALKKIYQQNFVHQGYDNPSHKQERYNTGLTALTTYYQQQKKLFGQPFLLEQPFSLRLPSATLNGKIDRIDLLTDNTYQIIDYKTGTHKDQKQADKDEQLTIYNLAVTEIFKLPITKMSFYYLETSPEFPEPEVVTTTRTSKQRDLARKKLEKRVVTLQKSSFSAKPNPVNCGYCEYRAICPFASKKAV